MTTGYHVQVILADNATWEVSSGDDPGDPFTEAILTDPLVVTSQLQQSDVAPMTQTAPMEATLNFLTGPPETSLPVDYGDTATIRVWPTATPGVGDHPVVEFAGRVNKLSRSPERQPDGRIVNRWTVGCIEYLADLAEYTTLAEDRVQEDADERIAWCFADAQPAGWGVPVPLVSGAGGTAAPTVTARTGSAIGLLDALVKYAASWAYLDVGTLQWSYLNLTQVTDPAAGAAVPASPVAALVGWVFVPCPRSPAYVPPLQLSHVGAEYRITPRDPDPTDADSMSLDASHVDMGVTFTQRKGQAVSSVAVTSTAGWQATSTIPGVPLVQAKVDTELLDESSGVLLANTYLPPVTPSAAALWMTEQINWYADQEDDDAWTVPQLRTMVSVLGVATDASPNDREWFAAMTGGWQLTLAKGKPAFVLGLLPWQTDPAESSDPFLISDWGPAVWGVGIPINQLYPRDTIADYQLVKGP